MKTITAITSLTSAPYLASHSQLAWADLCGTIGGFSLYAFIRMRKRLAREKAER